MYEVIHSHVRSLLIDKCQWLEDDARWTSGYATWFTAADAIRIAHYDVIDDVITRKL